MQNGPGLLQILHKIDWQGNTWWTCHSCQNHQLCSQVGLSPISMPRFSFSVLPLLPPSSVIITDRHDILLASLKRNGAIGASVLSFGHSFNHRVADLMSNVRHQDELAFKFAPGPILWQILTPNNPNSRFQTPNNILTDFFWETSQKLFEETVVIISSYKKSFLTMSKNQSDGWSAETDKQNFLPTFLA